MTACLLTQLALHNTFCKRETVIVLNQSQIMKRRHWLAAATLLLFAGFGSSLTMARSPNYSTESLLAHEPHNESPNNMISGEAPHQHKNLEIPVGQAVPTVDLTVHPDAVKGVNLEVKVANFRFAPEKINQESKLTEGHGHLYIDGKKMTRLYGSWYYLADLEPGQRKITVTLNANGHENLVHQGKMIEDTEVVSVPATKN